MWLSQIKILSLVFTVWYFCFYWKTRKKMWRVGEEEWRKIDSSETVSHFHIHRMLKFGWGSPQKRSDGKLIKNLIGWHGCEFFLCDYNYKWFSIIVDVKRSAKIRFVVPSCVYTSNWAHEVMIMQDVYLCIVEVQQWCVCKVIDTSCALRNYICNYHNYYKQNLKEDTLLQTRSLHDRSLHCFDD